MYKVFKSNIEIVKRKTISAELVTRILHSWACVLAVWSNLHEGRRVPHPREFWNHVQARARSCHSARGHLPLKRKDLELENATVLQMHLIRPHTVAIRRINLKNYCLFYPFFKKEQKFIFLIHFYSWKYCINISW